MRRLARSLLMSVVCLLPIALALGQAGDRTDWLLRPQLAPGLELVYRGIYEEEMMGQGVQFQRAYQLETTILVLREVSQHWDIAVMTSLGLQPDGPKSKSLSAPSSVRLETGRVTKRGATYGDRNISLYVPLAGPPIVECGGFIEFPATRVGREAMWEVSESERPPRTWQVVGTEPWGGTTCLKLVGRQQSEEWDRPRADRGAWRRKDTVWLSPQLGIAYKVERTIERREPARREPSHRLFASYEIKDRLIYRDKLLDDRKQEILKARKFADEAAPLTAQPAVYRPQIEGLIHKVSLHAKQPPTPYRRAVEHLQRRLEQARNGETPHDPIREEPPRRAGPSVAVGQRVPDFVVSNLTTSQTTRLQRELGRPVFLFFYNPSSETGMQLLRFAQGLHERYKAELSVMALAVTNNADLVRRQHAEMRLPFAILDGSGLHLTFGVDATPRLVIIDGQGTLRAAFTGWGAQTPRDIVKEIELCLPKGRNR